MPQRSLLHIQRLLYHQLRLTRNQVSSGYAGQFEAALCCSICMLTAGWLCGLISVQNCQLCAPLRSAGTLCILGSGGKLQIVPTRPKQQFQEATDEGVNAWRASVVDLHAGVCHVHCTTTIQDPGSNGTSETQLLLGTSCGPNGSLQLATWGISLETEQSVLLDHQDYQVDCRTMLMQSVLYVLEPLHICK